MVDVIHLQRFGIGNYEDFELNIQYCFQYRMKGISTESGYVRGRATYGWSLNTTTSFSNVIGRSKVKLV